MKKSQIASTLVVGFLIGVCTVFGILILFSLIFGNGDFLPATTALIEKTGSPIAAVTLQFFVGGGVGMLFYSLSFIWKHPKLTLKKTTDPAQYLSVWIVLGIFWGLHCHELGSFFSGPAFGIRHPIYFYPRYPAAHRVSRLQEGGQKNQPGSSGKISK